MVARIYFRRDDNKNIRQMMVRDTIYCYRCCVLFLVIVTLALAAGFGRFAS